mgnify:CR=1 FL=1
MAFSRPVARHVSLAPFTRFGIGGAADAYFETGDETEFVEALREAQESGEKFFVLGGGTNLVVSDAGFRGLVLRYTGAEISSEGAAVRAQSGAELQALVDYTVDRGLKGIETLSGIPGRLGAAIYGNAGAYGHSISECVASVRFCAGGEVRELGAAECEFAYRESIFKRRKDWIILSARFEMQAADAAELRATADAILRIRNEKFPPTMKCAGSIFKNLLAAELPPEILESVPASVIREGKAPAAYFLEQAGAKELSRGALRVAPYHANLIYNEGGGTARDLCALIAELKELVRRRFGIELEEEVQYVGDE